MMVNGNSVFSFGDDSDRKRVIIRQRLDVPSEISFFLFLRASEKRRRRRIYANYSRTDTSKLREETAANTHATLYILNPELGHSFHLPHHQPNPLDSSGELQQIVTLDA